MKRLLLVIQLGLIAITCNVNASIINFDTDDYDAYKDTETGLVWLDFGQNNNQSYNDVASQLGTGGEWEGWRLPTSAEVFTMWANVADLENVEATVEEPDFFGDGQFISYDETPRIVGADDSVWEDVFDIIGFNAVSYISTYVTSADAIGMFIAEDGESIARYGNRTTVASDPSRVTQDIIYIYTLGSSSPNYLNEKYPARSTLLVLQTASPPTDLPAPSTIAILGLGLLGLVARRKLF